MNCHKYDPYEVRCPGSGEFGKRLWYARFFFWILGMMIGIGCGYSWHYIVTVDAHQERVALMNSHILTLESKLVDYRNRCLPLESKAVNVPIRKK